MEVVNSVLNVQDLKDADINLVVVDLFKYSVLSIYFHFRLKTNQTLRQKIVRLYSDMVWSECSEMHSPKPYIFLQNNHYQLLALILEPANKPTSQMLMVIMHIQL